MDFCACGQRAVFRCACGTLLCSSHLRGTYQHRTGRGPAGFPDIREQVWQAWNGRPQQCCSACCRRHTREVAQAVAVAVRGTGAPEDLALALLAADTWAPAGDPDVGVVFGQEAVLALVPSAPPWLRRDAIDTAAALLASRATPTVRHAFYRLTTRQRTFGTGWKQTCTDLGGGVLAWSFEDDPAFGSDERLWVGAAGGNILRSEISGMARIEKDGRFGWCASDAAPEKIDAVRRRLLAPPPPGRSDRPWPFLGRIAAAVARRALS